MTGSSQPDRSTLHVVQGPAELSATAVQEFAACAERAIGQHGRFCVALSGGNTPRSVYSLLGESHRTSLAWAKIHIFFGDERHVPPDHPESNYRMVQESLLTKIRIPKENIHRIRAELPAQQAADEYEQELRDFFRVGKGEWPRFDLILLGIGDEGHTASLFPDSAALSEESRLVVANWIEKFKTWRITFTFPILNHAAEVIFLVSGSSKAGILRDVFDPSKRNSYPAQAVQLVNGKLLWLADEAAAALLSSARGRPR